MPTAKQTRPPRPTLSPMAKEFLLGLAWPFIIVGRALGYTYMGYDKMASLLPNSLRMQIDIFVFTSIGAALVTLVRALW